MNSRTVTAPPPADLAASTLPDRNRAVDVYRVVAMVLVAVGHWLVIAVGTDDDGALLARNALEDAPRFGWLTWGFQVMPLFFAVGGFASAMSLDAHRRRRVDGDATRTDADWIIQRLRRLVAPTATLAATWLVLVAAGGLIGVGGLVVIGAIGAAIPLWFLANYTIDTALAPTMRTLMLRNRVATMAGLAGVFATVEVLHAVAGVPWVGQVNWVVGWLMFQMIGFLWRDGVLPTGRVLIVGAAALWAGAIAMVALGPWGASMIHVPGTGPSPTHPPSVALVVFGLAQAATAIAAAPSLTRMFVRSRRGWSAVVAGAGVSMSVYLWHFTAAVVAAAAFHALGLLPTAEVGSGAWWAQKVPLVFVAAGVLVAIVAVVSRIERRALLAARVPWTSGVASALLAAAVVSVSIKAWSSSTTIGVLTGCVGVCLVAATIRPRQTSGVAVRSDHGRTDEGARTAP